MTTLLRRLGRATLVLLALLPAALGLAHAATDSLSTAGLPIPAAVGYVERRRRRDRRAHARQARGVPRPAREEDRRRVRDPHDAEHRAAHADRVQGQGVRDLEARQEGRGHRAAHARGDGGARGPLRDRLRPRRDAARRAPVAHLPRGDVAEVSRGRSGATGSSPACSASRGGSGRRRASRSSGTDASCATRAHGDRGRADC